MVATAKGSNIVIDKSVAGSVFPQSERDIVFPVLIDGSASPVRVEGAVYGRELQLRGDVRIDGPVVVRGDARITARGSVVRLNSGITVNGSMRAVPDGDDLGMLEAVRAARLILRGDITVNQNLSLRDAIVFGSIRAVNCTLERCVVLGTCIVSEQLRVSNSSIGGYAAGEVEFEGECTMIHALGESKEKPRFVPFEAADGAITPADVCFYPLMRSHQTLLNRRALSESGVLDEARLYPNVDWVLTAATANAGLAEDDDNIYQKWVLSLGGRIADYSAIKDSVQSLTQMLKCGFEFEHYHPDHRARLLKAAKAGLTEEEDWILDQVCSLEEI
jgi:hypothetical protein